MTADRVNSDPSSWDPALDAVTAAPKHHKVLFQNERLRGLEVTIEGHDEEPVHHHRWSSVFVIDQLHGPVHDIAPDGAPRRCHGALDLRCGRWPNNRADEENQLQRISFPA